MLALKGRLGRPVGAVAWRRERSGARKPAWRMAALLPIVLTLAGCSLGHDEAANLPVACETAVCDCAGDTGFTAKPPALLWKTDGTAYCPTGYHLHMPPPPSQRWTVQ
jgi:hypothetical protein